MTVDLTTLRAILSRTKRFAWRPWTVRGLDVFLGTAYLTFRYEWRGQTLSRPTLRWWCLFAFLSNDYTCAIELCLVHSSYFSMFFDQFWERSCKHLRLHKKAYNAWYKYWSTVIISCRELIVLSAVSRFTGCLITSFKALYIKPENVSRFCLTTVLRKVWIMW